MKFLILITALSLASFAQAAITGQQYCNRYMCITGQHDSDKSLDTYTLAPPSGTAIPLNQFGWIAIGFGNSMINSPMVIVWPNSDGSITLSQRKANNHVTPAGKKSYNITDIFSSWITDSSSAFSVDSNPPRKATLLTSSSFSNSSSTSIAFTLPSSSNTNSTNIIWAYGNKNPSSSDSGTSNIAQHLASGNTQIALLASQLPSSTSTNGTTSTSGKPLTSASRKPNSIAGNGSNSGNISNGVSKNILIAHVVCGASATMFILPIGILVPRLARGFTLKRWWFPVHGALNGLIAFGLIVAAFAIALANFSGGFSSTHRKLGLTLFILAIIQTLLGILTHWWQPKHKFQTSSGRGPVNFLHILLGITIVGVGFGTVWWGIDEEWENWSGTGKPNVGWKVGWGLVVAITALTYLGGLYFIPRQLKMEKERREWASNLSSSNNSKMIQNDSTLTTFVPPISPNHPITNTNINTNTNQQYNQGSIGRVIRDPNYIPSISTSQTNRKVIKDSNFVTQHPPPKRRLPPPL
uniref:Cytochrome b561 domain-containing protein n=1 Tax=Kwoniella pini CBS 10737 TaxID=1296096 RepID=A0A1B9I7E6_9TREE|nr:uncharacterized protein I206_02152 [Kwoniella pini CBS 10737]OCF51438.1 hypothetical protein I206_02152 [Kwoniella pini CBS 10737]